MSGAKRLDLSEKVIHGETMRRIYPSCQYDDGYIRRLCGISSSWDMADMGSAQFDIEKIREVLRVATGPDGPFSQRGLSKAADEGRDAVGDIINGRNKNPTIKVLSNIAEAMGKDLSIFGLTEYRMDPPSVDELHQALLDVLPGMPSGSLERRAEYLSASVAGVLGLPATRPSTIPDGANRKQDDSAKDAPPR